MAKRALRAERGGVGREEGEGTVGVLAVLGEVEMDAPDEPPAVVPALEKGLDREPAFREFVVERLLERAPERGEAVGVEIFTAPHRRRFVDQGNEVILGGLRRARRAAIGLLARGANP